MPLSIAPESIDRFRTDIAIEPIGDPDQRERRTTPSPP